MMLTSVPKILLAPLLVAAWTFDHPFFWSLHQMVRFVIQRIYPRLLQVLFGKACGDSLLRVELRHSVQQSDFNMFWSDVDFCLIINRELSVGQYDELLRLYKKIKVFLWNLGEIEIYLDHEWQQRQSLGSQFPVLQLIRDIRKVKWLQESTPKHAYHQSKRQRSLRRIAEKWSSEPGLALNESLSRAIERFCHFPDLLIEGDCPETIFHDVLGWTLGDDNSGSENILRVSPKIMPVWLAQLTINPDEDSKDYAEVKRLRTHRVIGEIWLANLQNELLGICSIVRVEPALREKAELWKKELEDRIFKQKIILN